MSEILLLGGSGFVSEALAKYLIRRGYKIDILTRGKKHINYDGYLNHIICDRRKVDDMKYALKGKSYSYIFDISAYTKNDVEILFNSLDCLNTVKRYIFCSSAAVYKNSKNFTDESSILGSNDTWGDYGLNKVEAENYILNLTRNNDLKATIFRPAYIYGEGNNLYREAYFFDRISSNKVIPIPDDDVKVQFIHIEDLVKNFECAMYNPHDCRAYNLTSPKRFTWEEIINICGKVIGIKPILKKIPINNIDIRSFFPFRSYDFNLDITALRDNGFHSPMIYLEEGLQSSYNWYSKEKPMLEDKKMEMVDHI